MLVNSWNVTIRFIRSVIQELSFQSIEWMNKELKKSRSNKYYVRIFVQSAYQQVVLVLFYYMSAQKKNFKTLNLLSLNESACQPTRARPTLTASQSNDTC